MLIDRRIAGGALLGVTIAVGTMVGASALRQSADSDPADSRTLLTGADALAMGCQPNEAALIQGFTFRGERGLNSQCVTLSEARAPGIVHQLAPDPATMKTVQAVAANPSSAVRDERRIETRQTGRTWKKTALVIGGSTAAGAGIGGLIGGRKGALIGSAIGGGSSTIYEAMKRR